MPGVETKGRIHDAVLWPATGFDVEGQPTVGQPVPLKVRWDGKKRLVRDAKGNDIAVDAVVHVDRSIANGSVMWLGMLVDAPDPAGADVMEVVHYSGTDDVKGRWTMHEVYLALFKDRLPG